MKAFITVITVLTIILAVCVISGCDDEKHVSVTPTPDSIPSDIVSAVPFNKIKITDSFWRERQKKLITTTIPHGIGQCYNSGDIGNLINAGKKNRGESYNKHVGAKFLNSDTHKVLEAMCFAMSLDPQGDQDIIKGQAFDNYQD